MLEFIYFAVLNGNSSPPCLKARKESSWLREIKYTMGEENEKTNEIEGICGINQQ